MATPGTMTTGLPSLGDSSGSGAPGSGLRNGLRSSAEAGGFRRAWAARLYATPIFWKCRTAAIVSSSSGFTSGEPHPAAARAARPSNIVERIIAVPHNPGRSRVIDHVAVVADAQVAVHGQVDGVRPELDRPVGEDERQPGGVGRAEPLVGRLDQVGRV